MTGWVFYYFFEMRLLLAGILHIPFQDHYLLLFPNQQKGKVIVLTIV